MLLRFVDLGLVVLVLARVLLAAWYAVVGAVAGYLLIVVTADVIHREPGTWLSFGATIGATSAVLLRVGQISRWRPAIIEQIEVARVRARIEERLSEVEAHKRAREKARANRPDAQRSS